MAFTDDFAIIGAAGDNFDCNSATGWSVEAAGGTTPAFQTGDAPITNANTIQTGAGVNSLELRCAGTTAGYRGWFQEVSSGSRFKITEGTLNFWFNYSKGKGANYLNTNANSFRVRLFFGGTTDWADYHPLEEGDSSLRFGWQLIQISGRNQGFGTPSDSGGGTGWTLTDSNWDRDIHRVELILDFSATNDDDTADAPLLIDTFFFGTEIVVSEGTKGGTPTTLQDLANFSSDNTESHGGDVFPLGLVQLDEVFSIIRCSIRVGNGSDGLNNEGYLQITSSSVLFNQWSEEVKHNIIVEAFSQLDFGEVETLGSNAVAVRGCQVNLPANRFSDVDVRNDGCLNAYNTKFLNWRNIFLGIVSDTDTEIELVDATFDSCETVFFFASSKLDLTRVQIYNNTANIRDNASTFFTSTAGSDFDDLLIHDCVDAIHVESDGSVSGLRCQDNTNLDVGINDNLQFGLTDSIFDDSKIEIVPSDLPKLDELASNALTNQDILFVGFNAPDANALAVVAVTTITSNPTNNVVPSISGGGITTWVQIATATIGTNQGRITLFRAQEAVPGSPASVTLDWGIGVTQDYGAATYFQCTEVTVGNNGGDAILESVVINDQAASTTFSGTLTSVGLRNISLGAFGGRDTVTTQPGEAVPETGYTGIAQVGSAGVGPNNSALQVLIERIDGQDLTPGGTWDRSRNYGGIVLEIGTTYAD